MTGNVDSVKPRMLRTPSGWLAVTPPEHPLRIGVVATTEAEAVERFATALGAWRP